MNKRTTIFRQLILNVVIPAILALMALGALNVRQTWTILKESSENKSKIISEEIRQVHEMQDMAMRILDKQIDPALRELSEKLVNDVFLSTEGIEEFDLHLILKEFGMSDKQDLYIINRDGIVVNTTYEADLNLNLFAFSFRLLGTA